MKSAKYLLTLIFLFSAKIGQSQTIETDLDVFPNPFICETSIKFDLASSDTVSLVIYNRFGNEVVRFFNAVLLPSGSYQINFFGGNLPDGMYLVHFRFGENFQINKQIMKSGNCETSSFDETNKQSSLFFPNPTNDVLNIPIDGEKLITITNLNGQLLKTFKSDQKLIFLSELDAGTYNISVSNVNNQLIKSMQIVFQK
jgi:hypothetical protein